MGRECVCGLDETCPKPGFMLCQTRRVSNLLARVSVEKKRTESLAAELAQVKAERDAAVLALRRVRFKCERELADINRIASGEPAPKDGE